MSNLSERFKNAWNAFRNRDPTSLYLQNLGYSTGYKPDRLVYYTSGYDKSFITSLYNRIAVDVSLLDFKHVRLDDSDRYSETIDDYFNKCLTVEANIDQTARAFILDLVLSLFDEGVVAVVPVDCEQDPNRGAINDIYTLRVAQIMEWYPKYVKLLCYNDKAGEKREIIMQKDAVAIIENPFYSIMNEPNSMFKRLINKLNLLDQMDNANAATAGKLDLILQSPQDLGSEMRRARARDRRNEIEQQLNEGKYGIAYIGATEKVIQLNRSVENNLLPQIEYLTKQCCDMLGFSQAIIDGTADERTLLNYRNRAVLPVATAIADALNRSFLTPTARTQKQRIVFFNDPFKLVPIDNIADIADKFTRNEILSSNEVRTIIGFRPVDSPEADELRNKNLNRSDNEVEGGAPSATNLKGAGSTTKKEDE